MVSTANASGRITITSNAVVITTTARLRLPHKRLCTARITGHVDTTTSVDQINAGRNGCIIHRLATIMIAMNSTANTRRGRSRRLEIFMRYARLNDDNSAASS